MTRTPRKHRSTDREEAASRSQRWREAVHVEDQLAAVEAQLARGGASPALRREAARLRAEHERLVALEGLCWPLRAEAHASVLATMQRASDLLARAARTGEIAHPRAPDTESTFPRPDSASRSTIHA